MPETQILTRVQLAEHLERLAARIRAGKAVSVGGDAAKLGERFLLETELEFDGGTELEIEVSWSGEAHEHTPVVGILTASRNDLAVVMTVRATLEELGVPFEIRVLSVHQAPDLTLEYVRNAEERGINVLIVCGNLYAHLAGIAASNSPLPVIGVPVSNGHGSGLDSLISTVQMPADSPVAIVPVNGARNAAILATRILSGRHPYLRSRLSELQETDQHRYAAEFDSPSPSSPQERKTPERALRGSV